HRLFQPKGGVGSTPRRQGTVRLSWPGVHARFDFMRIGYAFDTMYLWGKPRSIRMLAKQNGAGAVRKNPAQEILVKGNHGVLLQCRELFGFAAELVCPQPRRHALRTRGNRSLGAARSYRHERIL